MLGLNDLPDEILTRFSFLLDWKNLVRLGQCNKRFQRICTNHESWKRMCNQYWMITEFPDDSPMQVFRGMYREWGRYITVYSRIRKLWDSIFQITMHKLPHIYQSLLVGLSDVQIDAYECELLDGYRFPEEVRCSFRICGGQDPFNGGVGLIGSALFHGPGMFLWALSAGRSQLMGSGCSVSVHNRQPPGIALFIEQAGPHPSSTLLCLSHEYYGRICIKKRTHEGVFANFIAPSLIDFLETWVKNMESNLFQIDDGIPIMNFFYNEKRSGSFFCQIWTCPVWSGAGHPEFIYSYRVRISMDDTAVDCDSCRLDTRHWRIEFVVDGEVVRENVDGPGVVGEHPVLRPGSSHTWQSFTTFRGPYGIMNGHFKMDRLNGMEPAIHIECAPMHFKPVGHLQPLGELHMPAHFIIPNQLFQ